MDKEKIKAIVQLNRLKITKVEKQNFVFENSFCELVVLCVGLFCLIKLCVDAVSISCYTNKRNFSKLENRNLISRTSFFQFMGVDDALVPLLSVSELSRPDPTTSDLVRQVKDAESEYHKQ